MLQSTYWRFPGWPNPYWITSNRAYLDRTTIRHKVGEMLQPSQTPVSTAGLKNLGAVPRWLPSSYVGSIITPSDPGRASGLRGLGQTTKPTTPYFFDGNGNVITSAACGTSYGFTVPGREGTSIYLVQTKNGNPQFSGMFSVPMNAYSSVCNQDEGIYVAQVYDPATGTLIGSTTFQVLATGANPAATATAATGPGIFSDITGIFSGLTTTEWLAIGAGGILLIYLMKR